MPPTLEATVRGEAATQLRAWASVWADLLHAQMALHARERMPDDAPNLFARRALWEAAVVAYGRTAKHGSRQVPTTDLVDEMGPEARDVHDRVITWRDKHIAHRQDKRESVSSRAVLDPVSSRIAGIRVRVTPLIQPRGDDRLAQELAEHIVAMKDRLWETRLRSLEAEVIDEYRDRVQDLFAVAMPSEDRAAEQYVVIINPTN